MAYLSFVVDVYDGKTQYQIVTSKKEFIGRLVRVRVGSWMSWVLFLNEHCYASAGCLDEIRDKIKILNNNNKVLEAK